MPKIALTVLLLFSTTRLFALGLGNIELNSALNQPFDARIELLSPTSAEIDTLSVRLADLEAFNRAGIERGFILSSLQFEIEINDSGPDYIRITSSEAIREPYLNFLLEASWSSGRLFREYTVLLDPPLYDPNIRRIAVPSAPASEPESVSPSQAVTTPSVTSPSSASSYSGNEYGPTGSDDTLWSIASRVRPDTPVTVQQMMLALLRANPEAFIENNINGLREGQVLRIPDSEEISAISAGVALSQVQSQNSLWEEVRGSFVANVSQRPAGSTTQPASSSTLSNADSDTSELRLISPGADSATDTGQTAASFDSAGQGGADLALANEQLEALTAENRDLRGRLDESEVLIQDLQRLLELRDDELATLQQQAAGGAIIEEADEAIEQVIEDTVEESNEVVDAEIVPEEITSLALEETVEPVEDSIEEAPPTEEQSSAPAGVTTQPEIMPAQPGLVIQILSFIFGNIVLVGGALGALIVAIAALLFIKKRKESALDDELTDAEISEPESTAEETAMPEEESEIDSEIDAGDEDVAEESDVIAIDEPAQVEEQAVDSGAEEVVQETVDEPEDDPLAEVNVFLAYEHFDQAEEFIRDAIQGDPNNLDYHSKLLEVFYSSGDKVKYEEEAKVLNELTGGEGPHWEMATIMWQEISPSRELFAEPVDGEEEASDEAKGGGIVDLTADEEGDDNSDDGLDFYLGGGDAEKSTTDQSDSDDGMLDITSGGDDILDITADSAGSDDEDLLDVTAAVGLDEVSQVAEPDGDEDNMLDIAGDIQAEDDVLDISAAPGGEEDLLDVTAHTELEDEGNEDILDLTAAASSEPDMDSTMKIPTESSDEMDSTLKIPTESSDDNSLDFDLGGDEPVEADDDNVIDFDAAGSETSGSDEGLEISLDDGGDDSGDAGGIELDMGDDADSDAGLEISLDDGGDNSGDAGGIELDLSDDAGSDAGLEISLDEGSDDSGDAGGIELDMGDDGGADQDVPEISLDDDDEDDDEDHTVPRTVDSGEQCAEDEIATKLDLAKAYVELGDGDSAKTILDEIIAEGNDEQKRQAEELKAQVS